VRTSVRTGKRKIEPGSVRSQEVREHCSRRLPLRVAVLGRLNDLRVETQRRVVDEHSAVDGGQIHTVLDAVCESSESPDDVIAIKLEKRSKLVGL
jgi:hypothetical protein